MSSSSSMQRDLLLKQLSRVLVILDTWPTVTIVFTIRREKGSILSCEVRFVLHAVAEKK